MKWKRGKLEERKLANRPFADKIITIDLGGLIEILFKIGDEAAKYPIQIELLEEEGIQIKSQHKDKRISVFLLFTAIMKELYEAGYKNEKRLRKLIMLIGDIICDLFSKEFKSTIVKDVKREEQVWEVKVINDIIH